MKDPVVQEGDPVLRAIARPVAKKEFGSPSLHKIIERMKKVLSKEEFGVAIAAPQIGESIRVFVIAGSVFGEGSENSAQKNGRESVQKNGLVEPTQTATRGPFSEQTPEHADKVFINPVLSRLSRTKNEKSEGCLSVRGKYGTVIRHDKATIKAFDENGQAFTYHGSGLVGHIFQHECDHLNGILYTDKTVRLEEDEDMKTARQKLKDKHGV